MFSLSSRAEILLRVIDPEIEILKTGRNYTAGCSARGNMLRVEEYKSVPTHFQCGCELGSCGCGDPGWCSSDHDVTKVRKVCNQHYLAYVALVEQCEESPMSSKNYCRHGWSMAQGCRGRVDGSDVCSPWRSKFELGLEKRGLLPS